MATKKAASKKVTSVKTVLEKHPLSKFHPLYGKPILEAVRSGDIAQMKQIRAFAQKHVKEVQSALEKLEARINKG